MAAPFDLVSEAGKLVRFNTVTWSSNADCAVYVGSLMRKIGLEISYQENREAGALFMNVIGSAPATTRGGAGKGKGPLLMATHLDTVPAGDPALWTKSGRDPWKLTGRGDTLVGLGSADTKLDLLCKLMALGQVDLSKLKRQVLLVGTFGEESGMRGAARLCQGDLPRPAMALVGEPTDLCLVTRHKGFSVLEVIFKSRGLYRPSSDSWRYEAVFTGQAAHSSTPDLGKNALQQALAFLQDLRKRFGKVIVLSLEGGEAHNMIPASARLWFSLGDRPKTAFPARASRKIRPERVSAGWYSTLPWENGLWCLETLAAALAPLQKVRDKTFNPAHLTWNLTRMRESKEEWTLVADLRALPGQNLQRAVKGFEEKLWKKFGPPGDDWQFRLERDNPALETDEKGVLVKEARAALRKAKMPARLAAKAGCSEAGLYGRVGIPSIVFGPGRSVGNIHRPNEAVSLKQVRAAVRFYKAFLERTCF